MTCLTAAAAAGEGVKVGVLTCKIAGGVGYVIWSSKAVDCVFQPRHGRWRDHYVGSIRKFGADVGVTMGTQMAWAVFAPGDVGRGALAGSYFGATGEATVGVGVGANVLFGGFQNSINLQPVSVQMQTGFNAAGGVANLTLVRH
jgi:hypothetical protein